MSKRAPKLQFTDEELAVPEVSKAAKKAARWAAQHGLEQSVLRSWNGLRQKFQ